MRRNTYLAGMVVSLCVLMSLVAASIAAPAKPTSVPTTSTAPAITIEGVLEQVEAELPSLRPSELPPSSVRWDLVYLWAAAGQRERAEGAIRPVTDAKERDQLLLRVIGGMTAGGEVAKATKIAEGMPEKNQKWAFREIVAALASRCSMAEAEKFTDAHLKDDRDALFFAMIENRDIAGAEIAAIRANKNEWLDSIVGCKLLDGDIEGATATASKMNAAMVPGAQKRIDAMRSEAPFRQKWSPVSRKYAAFGRLTPVQDAAWTSMSRSIAVAMTSKPKSQDANTALSMAASDAATVKSNAMEAMAYTYVAIAADECGNAELAIQAADKAFTASMGKDAPGDFCRSGAGWLVAMLVRQGEVNAAVQYALMAQKLAGNGSLVAQWMGYSLVRAGKNEQFAAYVKQIQQPSHRVYANIGAAMAILASKNKNR